MLDPLLLQNGGHVGLGYIAIKGAVTKHHLGIAGGLRFFTPKTGARIDQPLGRSAVGDILRTGSKPPAGRTSSST